MHYKTIILELLQDRPGFYEELRSTKRLLPSMEEYAIDLRNRHLDWKASLMQQRPVSDQAVIASDALELAIEEMMDRLPSESNQAEAANAGRAERNFADLPPA